MLQNETGNSKLHQAETILSEALKLNSDLGCHVKNCSFSTHLTGRFYQNNSLESHKARSYRIAQMKAKRKQLERSLELEEKKILFLEKKLKERQLQRLQAEEMKKRAERAAILIQSHVRRMLSIDKLEVLRVENEIINYVVRFIQSLFRGRRDRIRVHNLRLSIIRHRKEELASIKIQSKVRQFLAKVAVGRKLEEQMVHRNKAACVIQSSIRGYRDRHFARNLKRERCAIKIQSQYRGMVGRGIRDARMKARRKKREKAQRVPLHERRYSTYSVESSRKESVASSRKDSLARRRFTEITSLSKNSSSGNNDRRLTGLEILRLMHSKEHQKENSEVDTNSRANFTCPNNDRKEKSVSIQLSKNHISEEKSIVSVSASASISASVSVSASAADEEQILLSRQRAAARAAKLKRQTQQQREQKLKHAKDRKKELDQLELKRRNMMKQRMAAKAQKKTKQKKDGIDNSVLTNDPTRTEETETNTVCGESGKDNDIRNNLQNGTEVCDIVLGIDFDDNFEEDFCENEFDLDDMG